MLKILLVEQPPLNIERQNMLVKQTFLWGRISFDFVQIEDARFFCCGADMPAFAGARTLPTHVLLLCSIAKNGSTLQAAHCCTNSQCRLES